MSDRRRTPKRVLPVDASTEELWDASLRSLTYYLLQRPGDSYVTVANAILQARLALRAVWATWALVAVTAGLILATVGLIRATP